MNVRFSEYSDRIPVVQLLKESHAFAQFEEPFSAPHAEALFKFHHGSPDACCIILGEQPKGILLGYTYDHPFGFGKWSDERAWFITEEARGSRSWISMLKKYHEWAQNEGCVKTGMSSLVVNDVSSLYNSMGYVKAETHYLRTVR